MRGVVLLAVPAVLAVLVATAAGATSSVHRAPRIRGATNSTSTNWSGYAVTGATPFTDVQGSWRQPAANCSGTATVVRHGKGHGSGHGGKPAKAQNTYSAFWVGLDGYSSSTVEQTGTSADCNGTTPVYYAWYEFYPAFPVDLSDPVEPGDAISAEVSVANGTVTITITDGTQHWTETATQPAAGYALSSAEWIAEAPSSGKVLPLADFGTVTFTDASATGGGKTGSIASFTYDPITMVTTSGQPKATPGGLVSGGKSFSVTWQHS